MPVVLQLAEVALGIVGGTFLGVSLRKMFGPRQPPEHPRMQWCGHCNAPRAGHYPDTLKCPCTFWDENGKSWTLIHFFKPLTLSQWMKREGLEE